jgi:hypothetical protein
VALWIVDSVAAIKRATDENPGAHPGKLSRLWRREEKAPKFRFLIIRDIRTGTWKKEVPKFRLLIIQDIRMGAWKFLAGSARCTDLDAVETNNRSAARLADLGDCAVDGPIVVETNNRSAARLAGCGVTTRGIVSRMNRADGAFEFWNFTFFSTKKEDEYKIGTPPH